MKAVRLHRYGENPEVEDVAEPELTHPLDVIVRIGGAGLCRTDLHIVEGQWRGKRRGAPPPTPRPQNPGGVPPPGPPLHPPALRAAAGLHPPLTCRPPPPPP